MVPDKDHIKKVFASKLKSVEQDPPAFMWERIESGLIAQERKPNTRKLIYKIAGWSTAAAAAVVAFGLFLFLPKGGEEALTNHVAIVQPMPEPAVPESQVGDSVLPSIEKDSHSTGNQSGKRSSEILFAHSDNTEKDNNTGVIGAEDVKKEELVKPALSSPNSSQPEKKEMLAASAPIKKQEEKKSEETDADLQRQIDAFAAEGLKTEKLLADNAEAESVSSSHKGLALGVNGGGAFSKADGYKRTVVAMANADQQFSLRSETVKLEHNQPITFGLSINKRITDRLSIESGINYAYLSSKIKSKSASSYSRNNAQYFHYLGIPLTLNYNIAEWNRLRLYISAGGAIQKDIYGRLNRSGGISQSSVSDKKNISQKNVQMSLTSSVGISYPIYGNMSVYTTVGGAYYIDAKNEYETIYSDKKWLLNLNLGVKFGF